LWDQDTASIHRQFSDYAAVDHRLEQWILSTKPEHEARRQIIREWMSLLKDKRQTEEQAKSFAKTAMERIPSSGEPYGLPSTT